ncbi:MAG: SPOR domain-containing protein [Janthinobacterium lividum]
MSQICSHCQAKQSDENSECINCGQPLRSAPLLEEQRENDRRFPVWRILPWTLLAAALLLLLPHLLTHPAPALKPTAAVPSPTAARAAASLPPKLPPIPLTVSLYSVSRGKHVPLGKPVMISAYAMLDAGESATIAISYSKNGGEKSLLSLTQGSLSSTAWTPLEPGHYRFTASALDSRKTSVFSRHLSIWADAPPVSQSPTEPALSRVTSTKSSPKIQLSPIAAHRTARKAPLPLPYHVAAAKFPVRHIAETLAAALRRRGFDAIIRPSPDGQGPKTYAVETGDYAGHAEAQKQQQLLQRDGYPAYLFRLR